MASVVLLSLFGFLIWILGLAATICIRYMNHKRILAKAKHDNPTPSEGPDVIVIGFGTVGSALVTLLARDGRKVTVIDKSRTPQEIIAGQSWMPAGVIDLSDNGLEIEPQAVEAILNTEIQLHSPEGIVKMFHKHPAIIGHNPNYVQALRKHALAEKKEVSGVWSKKNEAVVGVQYHLKGETEIKTLHAPLTVVADGKYSKFRSVNRPRKPVISCYGLCINNPRLFTGDLNIVHFVPTSVGPCFIFTFGIPRITAILMFLTKQPDKAFIRELASEIPDRFRDIYLEALEINSIKIERGYYLPASGDFMPGVLSLGDAYSMRDPCTSSGMTVGLKDTLLWRQLLQQIPDLYNYDAMYAACNVFAMERKAYSFTNDLFAIFFSLLALPKTDAHAALGQGYGAYISGNNPKPLQGIVDIYGLLEGRPHVLLYHMVLIILKAMVLAIKSESWWTFHRGIYKAAATLFMTSSYVVPHLWSELRSLLVFQAKPDMKQ